MPTIGDRFRKGWNAFIGRDPTANMDLGSGTYYRPDRTYRSLGKSIISTVTNRIAIDVAAVKFEHIDRDEEGRYQNTRNSYLNDCLTLSANIDQTSRAFIMDLVISMFDEGVIAVLPTNTRTYPGDTSGGFDIEDMRVAKVTKWFPDAVELEVYNELVGKMVRRTYPKTMVAIIENPLYEVMNEPNSTLQQLNAMYRQLDMERAKGNKLDIIIQLPYAVKGDLQKNRAEQRRESIRDQLTSSEYGIAYIDGTEHVTQLNRSIDNQIWSQISDLQTQLFNQLGLTQAVFDGSADERAMINYYNRTIEPICATIADEFMRKFLSKTARTQGQAIYYYRDPFKLASVEEISDMADKLTRNAILSSNEIRVKIGYKPSDQPDADELRNKNLNADKNSLDPNAEMPMEGEEEPMDPAELGRQFLGGA